MNLESLADHRANPNALQHLVEEGIERSKNEPSTNSAEAPISPMTPEKQKVQESKIYDKVRGEGPSPQKPLESTLKVIRTPKPIRL